MNALSDNKPCSLTEHLLKAFSAETERVALDFPTASSTFAELLEGIERTAGWFEEQGVQPGDRIAIQMVPAIESVLCYLASLFYGTVLVLVNPRTTEEEIRYFVDDAGARLVLRPAGGSPNGPASGWRVLRRSGEGDLLETVHERALLPELEKSAPFRLEARRNPEETALLCYTSGTTGRPKGAMITHGNLFAQAESLHQAWGWTGRDVLLHALPLFHVHGLFVALQGALHAGARTVLLPGFEPTGVLDRLSRGDCTLFMGVPTMYSRLLASGLSNACDLSHVRLFVSGSAPLSPEVFESFRSRFGHTILERYGMTEAGMVLSNPLEGERRPGSVGFPLPGVTVRIVEPDTLREVDPGETGELIIRSGSVCKGYWRRPEATREAFTDDGWLRSGDMARQDEDGYFYIVGRRKELIITGGFNVYPKEVENVLERHPGVREAAVFGMPDSDLGERVCAAVVPEGTEDLTQEALTGFCKKFLSAYKCPRTVRFLEDLPRNAMGKVMKERLKDKGQRAKDKGQRTKKGSGVRGQGSG